MHKVWTQNTSSNSGLHRITTNLN